MSDRSHFSQDSPWSAGVVDLGYLGPLLAMAAGDEGLDVVGCDLSPDLTAGDGELGDHDLAVVLTDHADLPHELIAESSTHLFDTRGVQRRLGLAPDDLETL